MTIFDNDSLQKQIDKVVNFVPAGKKGAFLEYKSKEGVIRSGFVWRSTDTHSVISAELEYDIIHHNISGEVTLKFVF